MFDLTILDVAIGLVLIYTLLSLLCSTINEGITSFFALRAKTLRGALTNLLGSEFAERVYDHHLVQGLVQKEIFFKGKRKPSYIPTNTFVLTVLDAAGLIKPSYAGITQARSIANKVTNEVDKGQLHHFITNAGQAIQALQ